MTKEYEFFAQVVPISFYTHGTWTVTVIKSTSWDMYQSPSCEYGSVVMLIEQVAITMGRVSTCIMGEYLCVLAPGMRAIKNIEPIARLAPTIGPICLRI